MNNRYNSTIHTLKMVIWNGIIIGIIHMIIGHPKSAIGSEAGHRYCRICHERFN